MVQAPAERCHVCSGMISQGSGEKEVDAEQRALKRERLRLTFLRLEAIHAIFHENHSFFSLLILEQN